jgi:hypothetical protein
MIYVYDTRSFSILGVFARRVFWVPIVWTAIVRLEDGLLFAVAAPDHVVVLVDILGVPKHPTP